MILGELGLKFIDERDAAYAAENERRIAADPDASPGDSQMFVFDHIDVYKRQAWACARGNASPPEGTSPARGVLTLSGRVIDDAYIGNGVQWDPYEVHDVDGRFSAADRKRLTDRLEYMPCLLYTSRCV